MKYLMVFEEFGSSDYLYHTPHIVYLNNILKDNMLRKFCTSENSCTREFEAVSLTRDEKFFYDEQVFKFKLNRKKLSKNYDIEQYIDPLFNGEDKEQEEITRENIYPLNKYLEAIQFNPNGYIEDGDIDMVYYPLKSYLEKYKIPFEIFEDGVFITKDVSILENLI